LEMPRDLFFSLKNSLCFSAKKCRKEKRGRPERINFIFHIYIKKETKGSGPVE
jgi:hypothetical protein